jgi:hypothetical protein
MRRDMNSRNVSRVRWAMLGVVAGCALGVLVGTRLRTPLNNYDTFVMTHNNGLLEPFVKINDECQGIADAVSASNHVAARVYCQVYPSSVGYIISVKSQASMSPNLLATLETLRDTISDKIATWKGPVVAP